MTAPDPTVPGRPAASLPDAERLAREHFGLEGRASPLPSDRDLNFRIYGDQGAAVLKLVNADEPTDALGLQERALEAVARALGDAVPRILPTRTGAPRAQVQLASGTHALRAVSWVNGLPWANARPIRPATAEQLGALLGRLDGALSELSAPAAQAPFAWDLLEAENTFATPPASLRDAIEQIADRYRNLRPLLDSLPKQWIHNDANDHNVMVEVAADDTLEVCGIIDFGDLRYSARVGELAVALAYAVLDRSDPLAMIEACVRGFQRERPLEGGELEALWTLTLTRLAISSCMAERTRRVEPDNPYLVISQAAIERSLHRLLEVPPGLAVAAARAGAGVEPCPGADAVRAWLSAQRGRAAPVLRERELSAFSWLDPRVESMGPEAVHDGRFGRYREGRLVYTADHYRSIGGEARTLHLGVDLFAAAGTAVHAPFAGTVEAVRDNRGPLDYGPTLIVRHEPEPGVRFWSLYGHMDPAILDEHRAGDAIAAGQRLGAMGCPADNGGWAPHVHLQLVCDLLGYDGDYPGVARPSEAHLWTSFAPDPSAVLDLDVDTPENRADVAASIASRRAHALGPSLSLSYRRPLHIVTGRGARLYDPAGRGWLDLVNNVCHVGHCHPRVVRAASEQIHRLNTNTRYLHENIAACAERLLSHCPPPLEVVFFTNSGSEANDLALRLARNVTGRGGVVSLDAAYHGNLQSLIDISPYKHDGPGGRGPGEHVRIAALPDTYRGPHRGPDAAARYAESVEARLAELQGTPGAAAFIHESILSCGGQWPLPAGYLPAAYASARAAGAVCIADEVQVGFGRVGSSFWAFEEHGVVPDILTMGKPMGNGHPVAAVVTTRAIADAFANGMEYFNTFGGNPVSCAVADAVLQVIEDEGLMERARDLGARFVDGLRGLAERYPRIGDVRGRGLFLGMEFVVDTERRTPDAHAADYVVQRMRDLGFLLSTDGPDHNVIKIKPPMVLTEADVQSTLAHLAYVLEETPLSRRRQ